MVYKTALVTGTSGDGIGRHAARALKAAGFRVLAGSRRPEAMDELRAEGLEPVRLDMTDPASLESTVAGAERIDVLVNNAAYALAGPVEELDVDALRVQLETNVVGVVRLTQLVLPGMRERGEGRVVNVSSMGGEITTPLLGAYHASKYALEALSDALRVETRGFGIRVSVVQPGAVRTAFGDVSAASLVDHPQSPYAGKVAAYRRIVEATYGTGRGTIAPDAVARAVLHAATVARPRTRYRVGAQAKLLIRLRHLVSDRAWDAMMGRLVA